MSTKTVPTVYEQCTKCQKQSKLPKDSQNIKNDHWRYNDDWIKKIPDNDSLQRSAKDRRDVMKPDSIAMDLLQGEQECFIGHVIPTVKLKSMAVDPAINPLVTALNDGLSTRFINMVDDDSHHIATISASVIQGSPICC